MAKIKWEFETLYDVGDVVLCDYHGVIRVGRIKSFSMDSSAGNSIWYIVVFYAGDSAPITCGDVAEFSIIGKIEDNSLIDRLESVKKIGEILMNLND